MGILTCLFFYFDIQKQSVDSCCSPLHSMPPLLGSGLLHCRVLVFFLPLQEDHVAQQLQLPSMAMAAGQSRTLGHLWQCVWPFRFPKNSREMTSWGVCSGVDGWWVRTFAPLSHLAGPPTVADRTHAVTPGAWRERLDERMNLLSVRFNSNEVTVTLVVFFPPRKSSSLFIWMWKHYWVISFASAELCEIVIMGYVRQC